MTERLIPISKDAFNQINSRAYTKNLEELIGIYTDVDSDLTLPVIVPYESNHPARILYFPNEKELADHRTLAIAKVGVEYWYWSLLSEALLMPNFLTKNHPETLNIIPIYQLPDKSNLIWSTDRFVEPLPGRKVRKERIMAVNYGGDMDFFSSIKGGSVNVHIKHPNDLKFKIPFKDIGITKPLVSNVGKNHEQMYLTHKDLFHQKLLTLWNERSFTNKVLDLLDQELPKKSIDHAIDLAIRMVHQGITDKSLIMLTVGKIFSSLKQDILDKGLSHPYVKATNQLVSGLKAMYTTAKSSI